MMKDAIYGGVNAAVLTPMHADLSVDLDLMAEHCGWLLANGCNGLGVLGTTGEANSLGVSERIAVLEGLVERGIPAAKMMPGTGTPAITDTVLLTKKAIELGCPGVLVLPPFYYKNPTEDGLAASFGELIERTGGAAKIYVYHIPQQTAVPITVPLVARLMKAYPGVVKGLKDSSGDIANTLSYVEHFATDGFEVYCGDDAALRRVLQAGGAGCITAASNVGSAVAGQVYRDWDQAVGETSQATLAAIRAATAGPIMIPGLKALVARRTGDETWLNLRPPHLKLSAEATAKLFTTIDGIGLPLAQAA